MPSIRTHTLLVVDDERLIVDSLFGLFRRSYNVFTATSGEEGLAVLQREHIHVVLSDQRMPQMSGTEFLIKVRELKPETVRILVTGYADIESVIRAVNYGQIYGYMTKPWRTEELELFVKRACEHHDLTQENKRLIVELKAANSDLERRVKERTKQLADLEQYKESIIANLQSGLMVVNTAGEIETLNPAGATILKLTETRPTANLSPGRLVDHPATRAFASAVEQTLATGQSLDYQEAIIEDATDERHIGFGTSALLEHDGTRRGVTVIFRDVTEKRHMEEQLIQAEKLAAIGELAGGIAHEINNPLGVILGFTQLVLKGMDETNASHKRLKQVEEQALRCKTIVGNLLKFARKSKVDITDVDLSRTIQDSLDLLHKQLEVENVRVERQIQPDIKVKANENELQQIFFNLVVNAKDAMEKGGVLTIEAREDSDRVKVRVSDTGCGIPQAIRERIFTPFFTTKPAGKGTGLGLPITRSLVHKFQGQITCESTPGRGTTFELSFPRVGLPVPDEELEPESAIAGGLKGLKVLVVDDEEDILGLYRELLSAENEVEAFNDPTAALARTRQKRFDLILLDMLMPRMDGREFLKLLGEQDKSTPPVIIVTGCASDTVAKMREVPGVLEILSKPFTLTEVEDAIRKAWDKHKGGGAAAPPAAHP